MWRWRMHLAPEPSKAVRIDWMRDPARKVLAKYGPQVSCTMMQLELRTSFRRARLLISDLTGIPLERVNIK